MLHALSAPMKQIADNCGIDGSVVVDEVIQKPTNVGYDANAGKYVDMFKAGIIDPVKVVRSALSNAASIAGLMLTTEALVTNFDKDDKNKQRAEGSHPLRCGRSAANRSCASARRRVADRDGGYQVMMGHFVRDAREVARFVRLSGPAPLSFAAYSPGIEVL